MLTGKDGKGRARGEQLGGLVHDGRRCPPISMRYQWRSDQNSSGRLYNSGLQSCVYENILLSATQARFRSPHGSHTSWPLLRGEMDTPVQLCLQWVTQGTGIVHAATRGWERSSAQYIAPCGNGRQERRAVMWSVTEWVLHIRSVQAFLTDDPSSSRRLHNELRSGARDGSLWA